MTTLYDWSDDGPDLGTEWRDDPWFWPRDELNRALRREYGRNDEPDHIDLEMIDEWQQMGYGMLDPWANPVMASSQEFVCFNMWMLGRFLDAREQAVYDWRNRAEQLTIGIDAPVVRPERRRREPRAPEPEPVAAPQGVLL